MVAYFFLRLSDPYLFQSANWLNPQISKLFLDNLKSLKSLEGPNIWYPPAVQWIGTPPIFFALYNLILFGVGVPYFLLIIVGSYVFVQKTKDKKLWAILIWVILFFVYQSSRFSKNMRYFIPLYPFLSLFAAYAVYRIKDKKYLITAAVLVLIWPLAFMSIYFHKNSRVEASEWIYQNLPSNSVVLSEHWDDALPILMPSDRKFTILELPVFDHDSPQKFTRMRELLNQGDFYILSSNRGWGSIPKVPKKYPQMSKFYKDLLANKTQYQRLYMKTSYPSLRYLGIPLDFPDDFADESFTVYDHPKVIILENLNKRSFSEK